MRSFSIVILLASCAGMIAEFGCLAAETYVEAQLKIVETLREQKHPAQERALLQKLVSRPDATVKVYNMLAESYLDDNLIAMGGGLKEAVELLNKALTIDPENGHAYALLAFAANMRGEYKDASIYATKSLTVKKPDPGGLRQRALAYSHLQNIDGAITDLQEFIDKGFRTPLNYMLLGDLYRIKKRYKEAADNYALGIHKGAGFQERIFRDYLDSLIKSNQSAKALQEINARLKAQADDSDLLDLRATAYTQQKDYKAAIADYTKAIQINPARLYYQHRADLYDRIGQTKNADADRKLSKEKHDSDDFPMFK